MSLQDTLSPTLVVKTNLPKVDLQKETAYAQFSEIGFPTTKHEEWKYTSLRSLLKKQYQINSSSVSNVNALAIEDLWVATDAYQLVFVDGVYQASLSVLPSNIQISSFNEAVNNHVLKEVLLTKFDTITKTGTALTTLNTAITQNGVVVYVGKNIQVDKPVEVLYLASGDDTLFLNPRNLIVLENSAAVKFIETHQSLTNVATFTNSVTEVFVGKNAQFEMYKLQNDVTEASLVDATFIAQDRDSNASVFTFSFGGKITRNNLTFVQEGVNCESHLFGITIAEGEQLIDHHTLIEHSAPDCLSNEAYKGIYDGKSTGVFNGKVLVDQQAQRINAYQQNDSVLLSDEASVNSKPQLEIFADDVKCSHGCTVGQLDSDSLFYMQQRGIPKKEAQALLMYAFCADAIETVSIPEVKSKISKLIGQKLSVTTTFDDITL